MNEYADEDLKDEVYNLLQLGYTDTKQIMSILDISAPVMHLIILELKEEGYLVVPTIH